MKKPNISLFCPAYNDEENIGRVVEAAVRLLEEVADGYEIIIVEDHSPDKTAEVADELARKHKKIRVIHNPKNLGYGGALKVGFTSAKNEFVAYTDGDAQYDAMEFRQMLPYLEEYDVVIGRKKNWTYSPIRKIESRVFNFLVSVLFGLNFSDVNCSMKIFKKKVLDSMTIESTSAFIDVEMLAKARKKGFKIKEVPVTHYPRLHGKASGLTMKVIFPTIADMFKQWLRLNFASK